MKFQIKKHWYQGDGWKYDLYSEGVVIKEGLGSVVECKYWAEIIKKDAEVVDVVIEEFEL